MEKLTVFSNGEVTIPKQVLDALNLTEGSELTWEIRGQEIVLSKADAWRALRGAAADKGDWTEEFEAFRRAERELEDRHS